MILYGFVVFIHVIVCLVLICVILLQAGRGGGLSESFGGSSQRTIFGTKTATFLTRATSVCAVVFIVTCLTLGVLGGRRSRSLLERTNVAPIPNIPSVPSEIPFNKGVEKPPMPPLPSEGREKPPQESAPAPLPEEPAQEEAQPLTAGE